jgi:hypothetical protein
MSNTIIRLKKSSIASHLPDPAQLEYGEIALNYADGKIFYKDASGNVQQISGSANSFSTISANGTYLVATSPTSILTINPGNNIEIQGDFLTDAFTIAANLKSAFDVANAAFDYANNLAITSNTAQVVSIMVSAYGTANAAFDKANAANLLAYNTGVGANNYAGVMANAANAYAASLTPDLSPAFNKANAAFGAANQAGIIANAAFQKANTSVTDYSPAFNQANAAYTIANAAFDKANTGTAAANANAFSIIAVPGQSNIVASINDTLTISPTTGINITTDPVSKTITISSPTGPNADFGWINAAFSSTNDYGSI